MVAAGGSNLLTTLKGFFAFDDAMGAFPPSPFLHFVTDLPLPADIYACHGVSGIIGLVFTGVFAEAAVAATDGYTVIPGGWIDGNYKQVGYQLAYSFAVWGWCVPLSSLYLSLDRSRPKRREKLTTKLIFTGLSSSPISS